MIWSGIWFPFVIQTFVDSIIHFDEFPTYKLCQASIYIYTYIMFLYRKFHLQYRLVNQHSYWQFSFTVDVSIFQILIFPSSVNAYQSQKSLQTALCSLICWGCGISHPWSQRARSACTTSASPARRSLASCVDGCPAPLGRRWPVSPAGRAWKSPNEMGGFSWINYQSRMFIRFVCSKNDFLFHLNKVLKRYWLSLSPISKPPFRYDLHVCIHI